MYLFDDTAVCMLSNLAEEKMLSKKNDTNSK